MTLPASRPRLAAAAIGAASLLLFCRRLATPHVPVFDEIHYVPAARALLALSGPVNTEHPLLGKALIAAGIALVGDQPFGWRLPSALAGTAVVLGVFWILWLAFRSTRTAAIGAILTLCNFTVFVQARIAMLDGFMAAFVVLATGTALWAMHGRGGAVPRRWLGAGVLLGLAVACKWTAAPYVGFAAAAFLLLKRSDPARWAGLGRLPALAMLGATSVAGYLASFAPAFFYARDPLRWATLLPFQLDMYRQQTQVLPPHVYQSAWWSWPLLLRPIWYFYRPADGALRGVLMIGNPAVMWAGLVAVAALLVAGWRHRSAKPAAIAALWLCGFLTWAAVPKSPSFFYYYYLPSIWLPVALAAAFHRWRRVLTGWDEAFVLLSVALFAWFHPILSAGALAGPGAFGRWMWFSRWI